MKKVTFALCLIFVITATEAQQWTNNGDNYTSGKLGIGSSSIWAPITINSVSSATGNLGVSLAFEGANYSEVGYRFSANGSNYYQVLYNGSSINWKHFEGGSYIPKLSLTNSGYLGIGTSNPSAELEVKSSINNSAEIHINSLTEGKSSIIRFQNAGTNMWGLLSNYPGQDMLSIYNYHNNTNAMVFGVDGNVGIGTNTASTYYKLAVNGAIHTKEVKVDLNGWSDFVFDPSYRLRTLEEVERQIYEQGHLLGIPSEADVIENGINLGEMNAKLLQKIEELTLYLIEQNKQLKVQNEQIEVQQIAIEELKNEVKLLKKD